MSGLHKSFPPIPPRPYWRTHEVSTKFANNLLLYKHFYYPCRLAFSSFLKLRRKQTLLHIHPSHTLCSTLNRFIPTEQVSPLSSTSTASYLRRSFNTKFLIHQRKDCRSLNPNEGGNAGGQIPLVEGMPEAQSLPSHKNKPRNLIPRLQGLPDLT